MSIDEKDDQNKNGEIAATGEINVEVVENGAGVPEDRTLPMSSEMEAALKDAMDLAAGAKGAGKGKRDLNKMEDDERQHFQNRIKELHIQLMEKTKEIDKAKEAELRRAADLDNYKKRVQRDQAEKFNYGNEDIAKAFLEVFDNLQRAADHADQYSPEQIKEGVKLTFKQMEQILAKFGVKPIATVGEKFDPNFHEALSQYHKEGVEPGIVLEEHQKGFMLKDRLLRPSRVVVSAKQPK